LPCRSRPLRPRDWFVPRDDPPMRPELSALLTRYRNDMRARESLRAWRKQPLALRDRRDVARAPSERGLHRAAALWWCSACRYSAGDARDTYQPANALRMAERTWLAEKLLRGLCECHPEWSEPAHSLTWLYRL